MDHSYSESDVSLSPTQVFEKIEMLRQLHLMQRGELVKQHIDYQNSPEISSSITEIISHFSNSTTYNTFRSILQSTDDNNTSQEVTPRDVEDVREFCSQNVANTTNKNIFPVMEGVSILNISQESEYIPNSPVSSHSTTSNISKTNATKTGNNLCSIRINSDKKQISLDDMPILSPKKNFEQLVVEKLKDEQPIVKTNINAVTTKKKQFLRKGEGMGRFGLQKKDLIIQNTKSLPWRKKEAHIKNNVRFKPEKSVKETNKKVEQSIPEKEDVIQSTQNKASQELNKINEKLDNTMSSHQTQSGSNPRDGGEKIFTQNSECNKNEPVKCMKKSPKVKHPIFSNKGKTWAAVLTKEQNDFLKQLKQSDYYKNFSSPAKSIDTDVSCSDSITNVRHIKEIAEQNLFDLMENKVSHESFNIENSFFNRFINRNKMECSGESTPLIMQKCLSENPGLLQIGPNIGHKKRNIDLYREDDTSFSECTDCSETCCSVSTCCSCKTTTQINEDRDKSCEEQSTMKSYCKKQNSTKEDISACHNETAKTTDKDNTNSNMAEMNAKLVATSELLKERLHELEDEIETFRRENASINKMREEIDLERQKFYEEKAAFEQKFNEDKILSEYYLAEEKEKLTKQKQLYERYVKDMRGRLNKKDKEEVINLKNEINKLKEEIRLKDAKSTSTVARLRNQIKLIEKDKKALEDEIEKLKKENRRIMHSNDVTRRLTNIKYLEEINKKLSNMASRETQSVVEYDSNSKYKTLEIEQQQNLKRTTRIRNRTKSVPNLNVTSKYAKYFSQKDSLSDKVRSASIKSHTNTSNADECSISVNNFDDSGEEGMDKAEDDENYLERIYNERFKKSPSSKRSSGSNMVLTPDGSVNGDTGDFFLQKSNSVFSNKQPVSSYNSSSSSSNLQISSNSHNMPNDYVSQCLANDNKIKYHSDDQNISQRRNKSPISIHSNQTSSSQRPPTVIYNDSSSFHENRMIPSPEPSASKVSITKTSLNPIETKRPDGTVELRFPNGNVKLISADGKYSRFTYYNGDVKENFYNEGRVKYFYAESKTFHTTHPDGLEVLEFPDGQIEKRYKDGSSEIRLPNGSIRYYDPKNDLVREDWRFPDGTSLTISANDEKRIIFPNGQIEVHAKDHKRREFPDGTVKLVYNDGTSETRYASGRIRIKDKHGNLLMDSASRVGHLQNR